MLLPASQNFTKIAPTSALIIAYGLSFYFLAAVSQKLPLSDVKTHNIIARKIYFAVSEFQESLFQGKQISGASFPL